METTKAAHQAKMQAQLKHWSARLGILQAKVGKAGAGAKKDLLKQLTELQKLETKGKEHLASLENVANTTWDEVKTDLTDKWSRVTGAFDVLWHKQTK